MEEQTFIDKSFQLGRLAEMIDQFERWAQTTYISCEFCGGPHYGENCNGGGMFSSSVHSNSANVVVSGSFEQIDYMSYTPRYQNDLYNNNYNSGWWDHPSFGWSDSNLPGPLEFQSFYQQPADSSESPPTPEEESNLEELMMNFFQQTNSTLRSQQASIQNLENQIDQISKMLSERQPEMLHCTTESNPREHCEVITLQSGKHLSGLLHWATDDDDVVVQDDTDMTEEEKEIEKEIEMLQGPVACPKELEGLSNEQVLEKLQSMLATKPSSYTDPFLSFDRSNVQEVKMSIKDLTVSELNESPEHLSFKPPDDAEKIPTILVTNSMPEERKMTSDIVRRFLAPWVTFPTVGPVDVFGVWHPTRPPDKV